LIAGYSNGFNVLVGDFEVQDVEVVSLMIKFVAFRNNGTFAGETPV
jgi:hypothetical protein